GRLEGLKDASGNWTAQYRYTPEGIRSAVTEGTNTTLYVIDILGPSGYAQVIEERTAAGLVVGSYVYGPSLDPLSQWRSGGQGANLYLADGHSGVRQAVNLTGGVLLAQRFDAYGGTMATAGTLSNVIGYRGERFDNTLGQYYLRARYYNPATGRFTGMDEHSGSALLPITMNKYLYGNADPIRYLDPSGYFGLVGGLASMAIGNSIRSTATQTYGNIFNAVTATIKGHELGMSPGQILLNYFLEDLLGIPVDLIVSAFEYLFTSGYSFDDEGTEELISTDGDQSLTGAASSRIISSSIKTFSVFIKRTRKVTIQSYSTLKSLAEHQKHHLNQVAAFEGLGTFNRDAALALHLKGGTHAKGLEQNLLHTHMDNLFDPFRLSGKIPTVREYHTQAGKALAQVGVSPSGVERILAAMKAEYKAFGIDMNSPLAKVPKRATPL
ncbi:MAG: RHS repeat-associated core domain-containing protein, partial [Gemmataceae bacterium]